MLHLFKDAFDIILPSISRTSKLVIKKKCYSFCMFGTEVTIEGSVRPNPDVSNLYIDLTMSYFDLHFLWLFLCPTNVGNNPDLTKGLELCFSI
jgi:hypothetical protein